MNLELISRNNFSSLYLDLDLSKTTQKQKQKIEEAKFQILWLFKHIE